MDTDGSEDWGTFGCEDCGFSLWNPLAELRVSFLGFYDDARFPGRCLLVYREHVEHFTQLSDRDAAAFTADSRLAAEAILSCTSADRINYAILGNSEPHLHMHLIPRTRTADPIPKRPPWEHPESKGPLPPDDAEVLREAIKARVRSVLGSA